MKLIAIKLNLGQFISKLYFMDNKPLYSVLAAIVIAGGILWLVIANVDKQPPAQQISLPIKIGALLPLTGKFAEFGEDINHALALAQEDVKNQTGLQFDISVQDSGSDAKVAVPAASKLIDQEKIPLIIGGPGSSANLAVAPLMNDTAFIAISSTPGLNEKGNLIMKLHPDIGPEASRMVNHIYNKGLRRVGIIYDSSSPTLLSGKDSFSKEFTRRGGAIADAEGFDPNTVSDYRTIILKIKAANADAVYVIASEGLAGTVVKQIRDLGLNQQIFGWSGFQSKNFLNRAGAAAEGVVITAQPFSCEGTEIMRQYCARYRERFKDREPLQYGAHAYDLLHLLAGIVKDNNLAGTWGDDAAKTLIVDKLNSIRHYQGVSGDISFNGKRNIPDKDFVFRTVKDGKFVEPK